MTDSEIRTLRALAETMVKAVQRSEESAQKFQAEQKAATPLSTNWIDMLAMKSWAEGRLLAFTTSLNDLREAFPDELGECEHQWAASYTADDKVDGWDCMKCGAHRDNTHVVDCQRPDCEAERGDHIYHAKRDEERCK